MTAGSLTPALALAYLRELSTDVRAAAVLDADGGTLAGTASLAPTARELLAGAGGAGNVRYAPSGTGTLVAARTASGAAVVVEVGPHALLELVIHDLKRVLEDLTFQA